jgi:hypothetical protein
MKVLISALWALVMSLPSFGQKVVNDANAEARQVGSFKAIYVYGSFDVLVSQGNEEGLAVSAGEKEDLSKIKTVVENGVLKISFDQKNQWWPKGRKLKAYISVKNLESIKGSGAAEFEVDGSLSAANLKMEMSGATDFQGKINVSGTLDVELSGASDLKLTGNARDLKIEASGASKMKAFEFTTTNCEAKASGASSIQLTVEKELSAELSGASSLRYAGNAMIKNIKTSGASSIARK